jgi:hypothetical protein
VLIRIATGTLPSDRDADALVAGRSRLTRAASAVAGLEAMILAVRDRGPDGSDDPSTLDAVVVTIWHDDAAMRRAVAGDEGDSFANLRLGLPFRVGAIAVYEVEGRTFAALPPELPASVRILTVRSGRGSDDRLVAALRGQQSRLVDLGVIAWQLGSRTNAEGDTEVVGVTVWPDRATIHQATAGHPDRPLFAGELDPWLATTTLATYDGVEVAPRLPSATGPPLVILDQDLRIVDITARAAAIVGMPLQELVGKPMDTLASPADAASRGIWSTMLETGSSVGELAWAVPAIGAVLVHVVVGRDVPVPGRHAMYVRRRQDPTPTVEDLNEALRKDFPAAKLVPLG